MTYPAAPLTNPWTTGYVNATTMYNNTTLPLNQIQAVLVNQGTGSLGHAVLPANMTGITSGTTTLVSCTQPVVAGRKYLIIACFEGLQNTAGGAPNVTLVQNGVGLQLLYFLITGANITIYGTASYLFIPATSASVTFALTGSTNAGTLTVNAGAFVLVQDLGTT